MDSGQNPVESFFGVYLAGQETNYIDLNYMANQKVRGPTRDFGGKV